jgi:hypothetical protein
MKRYTLAGMDVERYLRSFGQEVTSLQQRVRYILADAHWQTDGEWKESVVRQVLRRYLPTAIQVSRGFVVTSDAATTQIDILVHDASKPVLFKDGDFVFVTPDAVLGLIEIKARVGHSRFREAVDKLDRNAKLVRLHPNIRAFVPFFAFETEGEFSASWLADVANAAPTWNHRLNFAAVGESGFIRYWHEDPANPPRSYESWHAYALPGLAAGYFVHNAADAVSPDSVLRNNDVWYPKAGKEP